MMMAKVPVAFAIRTLFQLEKNYGINEFKALSAVWAISHYIMPFYTFTKLLLLTDYSAGKVVL